MRRRPVYIAVLAIAAIALMLAVLTLYAGSRKAPAARCAASAPADVEQTLSPLAAGKNCAVFAAYSADGTVSDYVIDYLRALKEIAPNIVYVTDNPIPESEIAKLRPYVNHLIARRHGEYDWGSYKRGFAWLKRQNALPSRPAAASGIPSRAAIVPAPASDITAAASGIPPRAAIVPAPASDTAAAASLSSSAPVPHTASAPLLILANDSSLLVAPCCAPSCKRPKLPAPIFSASLPMLTEFTICKATSSLLRRKYTTLRNSPPILTPYAPKRRPDRRRAL